MIKTATLTTGTNEIVLSTEKYFYLTNNFIWIKNFGVGDVYASATSDCAENADGTIKISAGECGMINLSQSNKIYAIGSGSIEIHSQNSALCPFKVGAKGGDGTSAYKFIYGKVTMSSGSAAVKFPDGTFTSVPTIVSNMVPSNSSGYACISYPTNITTTSVTFNAKTANSISTTGTSGTVYYIAIGS